MRVAAEAVLLGSLLAAGACYAYRPASLAPTPGSRVRIVLAGATEITSLSPGMEGKRLAHAGVLEASGTIEAASGDTIALRLGQLRTAEGSLPGMAGRIALIPTVHVAGVRERRFQAGTTLLGGLGLSLLALSAYIVLLVVAITKGI